MSHEDATHGATPLPGVNPAPLHRAVEALSSALHAYVDQAVGVRAEFGAAEADEDPRILASEARIGTLNADLFDTVHDALGMHADLTSSVWTQGGPPTGGGVTTAELFSLGFVVTATGRPDDDLDDVLNILDNIGASATDRLTEAGFDVLEWAATRGQVTAFEGYDTPEDPEDGES